MARPLREVLVSLASVDPARAARLIASLLPAQGVLLGGRLNYDLTIAELGTTAVTVTGGGVTTVRRLAAPRSRLRVDFRIAGSALGLARLLAGSGPPPSRFGGDVRIMGLRGGRARDALEILPASAPSLATATRAGARLEPGDVLPALAHAVEPAWTSGHVFTVALEITGEGGGVWLVTVADGKPPTVRTGRAEEDGVSAAVVLTREAFDALLRDEPGGAEHRPRVQGDRAAVAQLKAWTDRVRGASSVPATPSS